MKNKTFLFIIVVFIVGIIVYLNPALMYKNYIIKNHIDSLSKQSSVSTTDLIPYEYDKLHIIYPYTSKQVIEKEIGIKSRFIRENQNDNYQTLIVVKNNKVISVTNISLYYNFQPLQGYNYIVNKENSKIVIHKHNSGYSFIEQYNEIEDSFFDIKYTLPGSYWEEDDEEPGKFYYLDIDTPDHISIKKYDNFKLSKYLETKQVLIEKDMYINNYKAKYLEYENILYSAQRLEVAYIININDSTYIFNLDSGINSSKENLVKNKETLYNIVQSVKE